MWGIVKPEGTAGGEASMRQYHVLAKWDGEAKVWVAESDDIPGLVTEADTLERLIERVAAVTPELLELNNHSPVDGAELVVRAERRESLDIAA